MDTRQLRYFLAVASERSFTRGAARLHMAQPPLSRRIQELEAELGAQLFDRESRPLKLTDAGQVLLEEAILVVERMDQLRATMKRFIAARKPRFTIGLVPSTIYARFPEVLRHFREVAPEIDLSLAEMATPEQVAALHDGRIDVGFDRIFVAEPGLRHEVLRYEPMVAALPSMHPRFADSRPLGLAEAAHMPLIVYPRAPRPSYADQVLDLFRQRELAPSQIREVRELQTALIMVASGAGLCIVPESVRRLSRAEVDFLPLLEEATSPMVMRFRKQDSSEGLRILLKVLKTLYSEWGWPVPAIDLGYEGAGEPDRSSGPGRHGNRGGRE
jgi:DNA-binding transcriptional LysR family regulator